MSEVDNRNELKTDVLAAKESYSGELPVDGVIGQVIGNKYRIEEFVAAGGWGRVYKARDLNLGRTVAAKVLHPGFVLDDQKFKRFRTEAEFLARLDHPNICRVFDYESTNDGQPVLIMEFLEGNSLKSLLQTGRLLTIDEVAQIGIQLCSALSHAAEMSLVHRDIKPDNIHVQIHGDTIKCKLVDFGLAKLFSEDGIPQHSLTETGNTVGSPAYMSPEQCQALPLDCRSDLYSLACVLYEAVCGEQAFDERSSFELMNAHLTKYPAPLSKRMPEASSDAALNALWITLSRALRKDPSERYQTPSEMSADLERVVSRQLVRKFNFMLARLNRTEIRAAACVLLTAVMVASVVLAQYTSNRRLAESVYSKTGDQAREAFKRANFTLAKEKFAKAIDYATALYGQADPRTVDLLKRLGWVYHAEGDYETGLQALTQAYKFNSQAIEVIKMAEYAPEFQHEPIILPTEQSQLRQKELDAMQTLQTLTKFFTDADPILVPVLQHLVRINVAMHDERHALDYLRQILDVAETTEGQDSLAAARAHQTIAEFFHAHLKESDELVLSDLGFEPSDPGTDKTLNRMKARKEWMAALQIYEALLGANSREASSIRKALSELKAETARIPAKQPTVLLNRYDDPTGKFSLKYPACFTREAADPYYSVVLEKTTTQASAKTTVSLVILPNNMPLREYNEDHYQRRQKGAESVGHKLVISQSTETKLDGYPAIETEYAEVDGEHDVTWTSSLACAKNHRIYRIDIDTSETALKSSSDLAELQRCHKADRAAAGPIIASFKILTSSRAEECDRLACKAMDLYLSGSALMHQNKYADAANIIGKSIAIWNNLRRMKETNVGDADLQVAFACGCRGFCYLNLQEPQLAVADLTKAIELRPHYKDNYLNRAAAYDALGRSDLSSADLTKANNL
jgi:tetratricopeptide (TPR) repeat protein